MGNQCCTARTKSNGWLGASNGNSTTFGALFAKDEPESLGPPRRSASASVLQRRHSKSDYGSSNTLDGRGRPTKRKSAKKTGKKKLSSKGSFNKSDSFNTRDSDSESTTDAKSKRSVGDRDPELDRAKQQLAAIRRQMSSDKTDESETGERLHSQQTVNRSHSSASLPKSSQSTADSKTKSALAAASDALSAARLTFGASGLGSSQPKFKDPLLRANRYEEPDGVDGEEDGPLELKRCPNCLNNMKVDPMNIQARCKICQKQYPYDRLLDADEVSPSPNHNQASGRASPTMLERFSLDKFSLSNVFGSKDDKASPQPPKDDSYDKQTNNKSQPRNQTSSSRFDAPPSSRDTEDRKQQSSSKKSKPPAVVDTSPFVYKECPRCSTVLECERLATQLMCPTCTHVIDAKSLPSIPKPETDDEEEEEEEEAASTSKDSGKGGLFGMFGGSKSKSSSPSTNQNTKTAAAGAFSDEEDFASDRERDNQDDDDDDDNGYGYGNRSNNKSPDVKGGSSVLIKCNKCGANLRIDPRIGAAPCPCGNKVSATGSGSKAGSASPSPLVRSNTTPIRPSNGGKTLSERFGGSSARDPSPAAKKTPGPPIKFATSDDDDEDLDDDDRTGSYKRSTSYTPNRRDMYRDSRDEARRDYGSDTNMQDSDYEGSQYGDGDDYSNYGTEENAVDGGDTTPRKKKRLALGKKLKRLFATGSTKKK